MIINLNKTPAHYINMPDHTHNKTAMQEQLAEYKFESITRHDGALDQNSKLGCTKAHHGLLNKLSDYEEPFLILEDDARIANFRQHIDVPDDADALYLGNSKYGLYGGQGIFRISAEKINDDIFRVYNMLGAHAILYLNKDYAKFIAEKMSLFLETGDHHDKLRAETMKYFNIYALNRPMFYQLGEHESVTNFSISDLDNKDKRWSH